MTIDLALRLVFIAVFAGALLISGTFRRRARAEGGTIERRAEGGPAVVLRLVGTLPLFIILLLYAVYPRALAWSTVDLPQWLRLLFAAVAVGCVPLIYWVFTSIGKNISETVLTKETHELVTAGPYRWVRHPLYAVSLLMLLSFSVMAQSWFMLAYVVVGALLFRFVVIPREEANLIAVFGDSYRTFQQRTGALIPRLW